MSSKNCALCLEPSELQRSHYIPKGVYKTIMRGGPEHENQSIFMDGIRGTSSYSNFQPRKELLCSECEHKFSTRGEDYVIPKLLTHSDFPLREDIPSEDVIGMQNIGDLDYQKFAYFALSIIWRGSVTIWPSPYNGIYKKLKQHEEILRRYLMHHGAFPARTFITVLVDSNDQNYHGASLPQFHSEVFNKCRLRVFSFRLPGVIFRVFIGSKIPADQKLFYDALPIPIGFVHYDFNKLKSYRSQIQQVATLRPTGKKMLAKQVYK